MCRGPVPQFVPITSIGNGARAVNAAAISVPLSIVPKVSIVTCAITGNATACLCEVREDSAAAPLWFAADPDTSRRSEDQRRRREARAPEPRKRL